METRVLRCPSCHPKYRFIGTVRSDGRVLDYRRGWSVSSDYVGYIIINADGVKTPPKHCPDCGSTLEAKK